MTLIVNDHAEFVDPEPPARYLSLRHSEPISEPAPANTARCDVCGCWFRPRNRKQKRCSAACGDEAGRRRKRLKRLEAKKEARG